MIDIDFFKNYNDSFGHLAGDDCLKIIAHTLLASMMRPTDFVARYGGEEFVCVLPGTDLDGAIIMAERLRKSIESLQIEHSSSEIIPLVTISLGISQIFPQEESDLKKLIDDADKQLYKAKAEGRNRLAYTTSK